MSLQSLRTKNIFNLIIKLINEDMLDFQVEPTKNL